MNILFPNGIPANLSLRECMEVPKVLNIKNQHNFLQNIIIIYVYMACITKL